MQKHSNDATDDANMEWEMQWNTWKDHEQLNIVWAVYEQTCLLNMFNTVFGLWCCPMLCYKNPLPMPRHATTCNDMAPRHRRPPRDSSWRCGMKDLPPGNLLNSWGNPTQFRLNSDSVYVGFMMFLVFHWEIIECAILNYYILMMFDVVWLCQKQHVWRCKGL